ncbi:MAG: ATP-binding protein [Candidatus Eisenbacteria bacterium]
MKVGTKLFLSLAVPMVSLFALFGYLDGRSSSHRLRDELSREGRAISRTVQHSIEDALRDRQFEDVRELVDAITGYERIFGVRLFDGNGRIRYQSAELESHAFAHQAQLEAVLATRDPLEVRRRFDEEPVVSFLNPLLGPDGSLLGAVQVIQLESFIEEDLRASWTRIALLTGAMILATALVISLVTRFVVTRPIDTLASGFRELGRGKRPQIPRTSSDEFDRLAAEFSAMCVRLDAAQASLLEEQEERQKIEADLRNTARLASLGELAAGLAHEIGTPLGVIAGRAEVLQRRLAGNEQAGQSLEIVLEQIDRISRIVRSMLDFARVRELHLADVSIPSVLARTFEFVSHRLEERGIASHVRETSALPTVRADAEHLQEVFLNVIMNASDAMPEGGTIDAALSAGTEPHPERGGTMDTIRLEFRDTGTGIAEHHIERVFDPFFTTKEVGRGTGLGLSISYGIVKEHGGWMEIESEVGRGTAVRIHLPVQGPTSATGPRQTNGGGRGAGRRSHEAIGMGANG